MHLVATIVGTAASAGFLYVVASLNLVVFVRIWRLFLRMRLGGVDERSLEAHLHRRGFVSRFVPGVDRPSRMYLVGLGFDTATEVALLILAGAGAVAGVPWYATLCIPVLFAAGMTLVDTLDGSVMHAAYDWAVAEPVRKLYVNLTMTGLSIAAALAIGTAEVAGLAGRSLRLDSGAWSWTAQIDGSTIGLLLACLFAAIWLASVLVWEYGRIEERWSGGG